MRRIQIPSMRIAPAAARIETIVGGEIGVMKALIVQL
jgi:hypothetical protein